MAKKRPGDKCDSSVYEPHEHKFKFLNQVQKRAWDTITENNITFLIGPAGTAKTHTASAWAIRHMNPSTPYLKIIHTRPIVEAGEQLGWLPGNVEEKIGNYFTPLRECGAKIGTAPTEVRPLAYMRGVTLEKCIAILDEAQNATYKQLMLYLTRYGNDAKMIITGDIEQIDIKDSGLWQIIETVRHLRGIGVCEFTEADVVRHPLVSDIIHADRQRKLGK